MDHVESMLIPIARRLFWWLEPEAALADRRRFLAQVMTLGTWNDVLLVRRVLGEDVMRAVVDDPPPGVFDIRSWHYWNARFGRMPTPPLPRRFST